MLSVLLFSNMLKAFYVHFSILSFCFLFLFSFILEIYLQGNEYLEGALFLLQ